MIGFERFGFSGKFTSWRIIRALRNCRRSGWTDSQGACEYQNGVSNTGKFGHLARSHLNQFALPKTGAWLPSFVAKNRVKWAYDMKNWQYLMGLSAAVYSLSSSVQISAEAPVPPPVEQSTADCARPTYASDQLVCNDAELQVLDQRLKALLVKRSPIIPGAFQESDGQWFKRRSRCAFEVEHRKCLSEAYADRFAVIETAHTDTAPAKVAKCKNLVKLSRVALGKASNGNLIVRNAVSNELIGVATVKSKNSVWKPALSYSQNGRLYDFQSVEGTAFSCKLK